jgi:hypothetical protein
MLSRAPTQQHTQTRQSSRQSIVALQHRFAAPQSKQAAAAAHAQLLLLLLLQKPIARNASRKDMWRRCCRQVKVIQFARWPAPHCFQPTSGGKTSAMTPAPVVMYAATAIAQHRTAVSVQVPQPHNKLSSQGGPSCQVREDRHHLYTCAGCTPGLTATGTQGAAPQLLPTW